MEGVKVTTSGDGGGDDDDELWCNDSWTLHLRLVSMTIITVAVVTFRGKKMSYIRLNS